MLRDHQAGILRNFFKILSLSCFLHSQWSNAMQSCVYSAPQNLISFPPICSDSCSSWDKFDKSFSFCNKAHVVPRKNSAEFVHYGLHAQVISGHVRYELEYIGGRSCGCAVPNKTWLLVSALPAMFPSSLQSTWYSTAVPFGVQVVCRVNLNITLLWQAGQWMIRGLDWVSSTLWTFNGQFCSDFKLAQQTANYVAETMTPMQHQELEHPDVSLQGSLLSSLFYEPAMNIRSDFVLLSF